MKKWLKLVSLALVFTLTLGVFAMGAIGVSADVATATFDFYSSSVPFENSLGEFPGQVALILTCTDQMSLIENTLKVVNYTATAGYAMVTMHGSDNSEQSIKVTNFVNGSGLFRFILQTSGGYTVEGVTYTITIDIYSNDDTKVVTSNTLSAVSNVTSSNAPKDPSFQLKSTNTIGDLDNSCGFIDSNLDFNGTIPLDNLTDVAIMVNGKPAHWNIGYLGERHCGFKNINGGFKNRIQIGIVGAEIHKDTDNTLTLTLGDTGVTHTQTFKSSWDSKAVTSSSVIYYQEEGKVVATIEYAENPGYSVGNELTGKCHDDHNNTAIFTVTAVNGNTVTMEATKYKPSQSLLELCDNSGVYTTVTIDTAKQIESIVGYLQVRDTDSADTRDVRILAQANGDYLKKFTNATFKAVFTVSGADSHTVTSSTFTKAYKTITANGDTKTAFDGCGYFGVIITNVPKTAVSVTATVTFTNGSETETIELGTAIIPRGKATKVGSLTDISGAQYDPSNIEAYLNEDFSTSKQDKTAENMGRLFDGTLNKFCKNISSGGTSTMYFQAASEITISGLGFVVANDTAESTDRAFKGWSLYGQAADGSWDLIALSDATTSTGTKYDNSTYSYSITDMLAANPGNCDAFSITDAGAYTNYKLVTNNTGMIQMAEIIVYTAG